MDFTSVTQTFMAFVRSPDTESGQELLLIPTYAAVISASILVLHFVLGLKSVNNLFARAGILEKHSEKVALPGIGKGTILWFRVARLLGCLALLVLSVLPFDHGHEDAHRDGLVRGILQIAPYVSLDPCLGQF